MTEVLFHSWFLIMIINESISTWDHDSSDDHRDHNGNILPRQSQYIYVPLDILYSRGFPVLTEMINPVNSWYNMNMHLHHDAYY